MNIKNILIVVLAVIIYILAQQQEGEISENIPIDTSSGTNIHDAFVDGQSDVQIRGKGVVKKVLPDDRDGSRHQKFILQVNMNQTVLVAHNIDVADRLPGLKKGDNVEFYGEYEWTAKGGVIHWTHRDTRGHHIHGWLKYNGKTYQ